MHIAAGNYLDRSTGSVYIEIGKSKIYFHERKIVAIVVAGTLYRQKEFAEGIVYKRVRAAVMNSEARHVTEITRQEMQDMAVGLIMQEVSEEMDKRLVRKKEN